MHRVCFMSVCRGAQHWEHVRPATYKRPPRGFSLRLPWLVCTAWGASSWNFTGLWAEWAHSNTRPHLTWGAMSSQDTREKAFAKRCSTMFKSSLMFQLQSPWSWKIRERERETLFCSVCTVLFQPEDFALEVPALQRYVWEKARLCYKVSPCEHML